MKHSVLILLCIAMGFTCVAKNDTGIDDNAINTVKEDLVKKVINPMLKLAEQKLLELNRDQALYDKLKDRKYNITSPSSQDDDNLENYLAAFSSLKDMFAENINNGGLVLKQINNSDDSDLKSLYQLIFAMSQSLDKPYDKATNDQYIKDASNNAGILPQHKLEFDELVSQINDYNFYMYELGRLFDAADEDNFNADEDNFNADEDNLKKYAAKLVEAEDAKFLLEVPYTSKMLLLYIEKKGELPPEKKAELKKACPDAFPDF